MAPCSRGQRWASPRAETVGEEEGGPVRGGRQDGRVVEDGARGGRGYEVGNEKKVRGPDTRKKTTKLW